MSKVVNYRAFSPPKGISADHEVLQQCYMCNSDEDLTEEHVIPRIFFSPSTTNNYIKLRACRECNATKAKEDEYFTRKFQATSFVDTSKRGFEKAIRGFKKGHGRGLRKSILDDIFDFTVKTQKGEFSKLLKFDKNRTSDYLKTIAKGLLVRNTLKHYDWKHYDFYCDMEQALLGTRLYDKEPFFSVWEKGEYGEYWQDIFAYRGGVVGDLSIWVMCIYSSYFAGVGISRKP